MFYATVNLYRRPGKESEFRAYETLALRVFRKHGGDVLVAFVPQCVGIAGDVPDEIQVLKIESSARFESFMNDPERIALAAEREGVIWRTELFISDELVEY
jgi:uncharacterized protein (DUF1330 family)